MKKQVYRCACFDSDYQRKARCDGRLTSASLVSDKSVSKHYAIIFLLPFSNRETVCSPMASREAPIDYTAKIYIYVNILRKIVHAVDSICTKYGIGEETAEHVVYDCPKIHHPPHEPTPPDTPTKDPNKVPRIWAM